MIEHYPDSKKDNNEPAPTIAYVPTWQHQIETLRFCGIDVTNEQELHSEKVEEQIYKKMIHDMGDGQPYSLELFVEDKLLSKYDIKSEDLPTLKKKALEILEDTRSHILLERLQNTFLKVGILSKEELAEAK